MTHLQPEENPAERVVDDVTTDPRPMLADEEVVWEVVDDPDARVEGEEGILGAAADEVERPDPSEGAVVDGVASDPLLNVVDGRPETLGADPQQ